MARVGRDLAAGVGRRWVVVDLEATCWIPEEDPALAADQRNQCEAIEIGAVRFDPETRQVDAEPFRTLVRPRHHPRLSAFCSRLTGIGQDDVDRAPRFPEALAAFLAWAGGDTALVLASWGAFDDRQLRRDADRWGLPEPQWHAINVKRVYARAVRRTTEGQPSAPPPPAAWVGLGAAVTHLGGAFSGRAHSALDDARNAAWVLAHLPAVSR